MEYDIKVTLTTAEFMDKVKEKYKNEFGKLDDRAYFMTGFLLHVFFDLGNPHKIDIIKKSPSE